MSRAILCHGTGLARRLGDAIGLHLNNRGAHHAVDFVLYGAAFIIGLIDAAGEVDERVAEVLAGLMGANGVLNVPQAAIDGAQAVFQGGDSRGQGGEAAEGTG